VSSDESSEDDELRDARALARALDGGAAERAIGDAMDAAEIVALLKAPLLDELRSEAILAETERRIIEARRRARKRVAWIGSAAGALALAAAALLMMRVQREPSRSAETPAVAPVATTPLSAAGGSDILRSAQLEWLDAPSADAAVRLERALASYRGEQLAVLARRYRP
jgi:hypothetical protein